MTVEMKVFPLETILTVTTGRLLTKSEGPQDNGIGDVYKLLEWMTGEAPFTHSLGRFAEECKLELLRQFPELEHAEKTLSVLDRLLKTGKDSEKVVRQWIENVKRFLGKSEYPVAKLPKNQHESKDPVAELVDMVGEDRVAVVQLDREQTKQIRDLLAKGGDV